MIRIEHKQAFERDGFAIVEEAFSRAEVDILQRAAAAEERIENARGVEDREGRSSKLSLDSAYTDDIWGHITRMPRMVRGAEILLGEEVYHWHSKIMVKEALTGGAWEWHQDYGYWYHDDPPFPQMISALLAVTDADKSNGCLRVLKGSHRCGRIEHGRTGGQVAADPERVQALIQRLQVVEGELAAGSVLFFHCNLLHSSAANLAARSRISYICCYNALSNPPLTKRGHGPCEPIELGRDNLDGWG